MFRFPALLLLLVTALTLPAQQENPVLDSLKTALGSSVPGSSEYLSTAVEVSNQYLFSNVDSCMRYALISVETAESLKDTFNLAIALDLQARSELKKDQLEPSIVTYKALLDLAPGIDDPTVVATAFKGLGERYSYLGQIETASAYMDSAMQIFDQVGDPYRMAGAYFSHGNIWASSGNIEKAQEKYHQSLELFEELGDQGGQANCLANLGGMAYMTAASDEAVDYFRQAADLYKAVDNQVNRGIILSNLGATLQEMGRLDEAIATLNECREVQELTGQTEGAHSNLATISEIYRMKGDLANAEKYVLMSFEQAQQSGRVMSQLELSKRVSDFYRDVGQYRKALEYAELNQVFRDSMYSIENSEALAAADVKREYALKALQDSLEFVQQTEAERVQFEAQTKVERRTRYGLIFGLLLVGVFGVVLYQRNKVTQRQKEIIEQSAQELAESEAQRTRFFANISHEFRTPLSVINGMSDLIAQNPDKWAGKGSALIANNGRNLLDLVNQLLDLQKLEKHELHAQYVQSDVLPYLHNCAGMFETLASSKGLGYAFEADFEQLVMDFDREKLLRIITNLVGNAVKFTESGSIRVHAASVEHNATPHLKLAVTDTGIGIPQDRIDRIFQRFYQVDNPQSQVGQGTGIGLNYVHELVQLLGGELQVESTEGKGSTFAVLLPVTNNALLLERLDLQEEVESEALLPVVQNGSAGPNLLIVEDNPDIVQLLLGQLGADYTIRVAENGEAGIAAAREHQPDVVLSDVMMPVKDGFELLDALKNDAVTSHIPVIMLTAKSDVESRLAGLRRGADDYIAKPFNSEELRLRLNNVLLAQEKRTERYQDGLPKVPSEDVEVQLEDTFLLRVDEVLTQHLDNSEFGIPEFCKELGISRTQLHNKLKALTGKSTTVFIRELRLEKAKDLLEKKELSVSEVAYQTGFSSPAYFSRVFTQRYGTTPSSIN